MSAAGEVVKGFVGGTNNMVINEIHTFGGAIFRMLEAALPFQYRPAIKIIFGELTKNAVEIDLAIPQRSEATGTIFPALVATINTAAAIGIELGIFYMKHFDAVVVVINEPNIVQLL